MSRLLNILDMAASLLTVKRIDHVIEDPTFYQVETNQHEYAGKILFQDSMVIKLKINDIKVVKILKENIRKITIQKEAIFDFN